MLAIRANLIKGCRENPELDVCQLNCSESIKINSTCDMDYFLTQYHDKAFCATRNRSIRASSSRNHGVNRQQLLMTKHLRSVKDIH